MPGREQPGVCVRRTSRTVRYERVARRVAALDGRSSTVANVEPLAARMTPHHKGVMVDVLARTNQRRAMWPFRLRPFHAYGFGFPSTLSSCTTSAFGIANRMERRRCPRVSCCHFKSERQVPTMATTTYGDLGELQ